MESKASIHHRNIIINRRSRMHIYPVIAKLRKLILPAFNIVSTTIASLVLFIVVFNFLLSSEFIAINILLITILALGLLISVILIVNQIFKIRTLSTDEELRYYSATELMSLYIKSYIVVALSAALSIIYWFNNEQSPLSTTYNVFFYTLDILLTFFAIDSIVKGAKLRESEIKNIEAENRMLKSRLNPHFLFNTLNNIDALIWIDQDKASHSISYLSSMMRYMTYKCNSRYVTAKQEFDHIDEYISLQRLRVNNPDNIIINNRISNPNAYIAPMIIISFIENIFKHGDINDKIIVDVYSDDKKFILTTENKISAIASKSANSGVGLRLAKERLNLLHKNCYKLLIDKTSHSYKLSLEIFFNSKHEKS